MSQVKLTHIHKAYETATVINDLSLEIADGEFLVLVGASGCGKSTLLRMIAGLEPVSSGALYCDGKEITHSSPKVRNFSMIFQSYALFPHMSVEQNITFGMKVRGEKLRDKRDLLAQTVAMLQLDELLKRRPKELSGGQRQRVAMARAIVRDPRLFLMDEPLSNLDAKLRHEVRDGIMALHARLKTTTVYVTHDQVEAMTMADRIVVLDKGEIQQIGSPEALYHSPANLFVASFIGSPSMNLWSLPLQNQQLQLCDWTVQLDVDESKVWLGLRPEHIKLGPSADGRYQMSGQLLRHELLGHVRLVCLQTAFGPLQFFCENDVSLPDVDATVTCHFLPERVHLFSGATQQRIADKDLL
ncbi:ABC transporter ATP-binding protein [Celerinatantimonas yamalensis]|uniref:ATP-binding cassette domain-containing protein n=1 Tax=Celerinatantimonas yamalensis TaxID=559956 RepID=A0ABW9GBB8_9GAMM